MGMALDVSKEDAISNAYNIPNWKLEGPYP